ncbi:PAS domain-containing protein [Sorangium sp. So ce363]|uniref:PAS domain-containing protein n=1 Tax=Sorangium sp. So ce363 TaxID=3133304 RepID=UPI003F605D9F
MTLDLDGPGSHVGAGPLPHVGAGPLPHVGVDPLPLLCALPVAAAVFDAKGALRCANPRLEQILAEGAFPAWPVSLAHTPAVLPASPEGLAGEAQEVLAGIRAVLEGEREQAGIALRGGAPGAPSCEISVTQLRVDGARGALVCVHDPAAPRSTPGTVPIESFLDTIIEHVPVSVFIKEVTEFRVVRMNGHYEKVFGAPRSGVLGKNVFDLFPHRLEEARWLDRMDRDVIEKGEIVDVPETRIATPAGERWLHMVKVPLKDEHGVCRYLLVMIEDITEKKRANEAVQKELAWFATQRKLLDVIQELSTPVIPVHEGILVVPLVGTIDSARGAQLLETLLQGIERHRAETVLIDITGVPVLDADVAARLLQATRAAALLGATCVLVGASPDVAQTLVAQGIELGNLLTQRDLQAGIRYALARQGTAIVERRRERR